MREKICFSILAVLTVFTLIFTVGCCPIIKRLAEGSSYDYMESEAGGQSQQDTENAGSQETGNVPPVAVMEIYQQNSSENYFTVGNTVYLSASGSMDLDGDILSYRWRIGSDDILSGEEIYYVFGSTGECEIVLTVYDGSESTSISRRIYLIEPNEHIIQTKSHDMIVDIEYIVANSGPGEVYDLMCLVEVPQTYQPFQIIENRKSNYSETDDLYTDDCNLIARFNLGSLQAGESANVYIDCNTVLYEYEYADISDSQDSYSFGDEDLSLYTGSEYYINSDSQKIRSIVKNIIGTEKNPAVIAEKLYDFVCNAMIYDEERLSEKEFGYLYASDILERGKGVCTDYAILYAALCRAAGIPARFVQGIPVFTILTKGDNRLSYGHAWVEIKLPGYGWIPIDITAESGFMSYNYYLNMETYKGTGIFYRSLTIGGEDYYPLGFYYSWEGATEPQLTQEIIYSVSGLSLDDMGVVSESGFLDELKYVLSEYNAAINHVNLMQNESFIFNDPQVIAVEEAFLEKLIEVSQDLENLSYSESYTEDRNNLVGISSDINTYKEGQIRCMKSGNYDCYRSQYEMFASSMNSLFNYYNNMVNEFNRKY
jgi:hypothetical protein